MKMLGTSILALAASLTGLSSFGAPVSPRLPIVCNFERDAASGYEMFNFSAFINQGEEKINFAFDISNEAGMPAASGALQIDLEILDGRLIVELDSQDPSSVLTISQDILHTALPVEAQWKGRRVQCRLLKVNLTKGTLPASNFDQYNLPSTNGNNPSIKIKTWKSSDSRFEFTATKYPASPATRRYPGGPASTTLNVVLGGLVIDSQRDDPSAMSYILYGSAVNKVIQTKITDPTDVEQLRTIFSSTNITLALTHPYGHTSPVQVDIDCSSVEGACLVTARN